MRDFPTPLRKRGREDSSVAVIVEMIKSISHTMDGCASGWI